jgi:hypothetical protein
LRQTRREQARESNQVTMEAQACPASEQHIDSAMAMADDRRPYAIVQRTATRSTDRTRRLTFQLLRMRFPLTTRVGKSSRKDVCAQSRSRASMLGPVMPIHDDPRDLLHHADQATTRNTVSLHHALAGDIRSRPCTVKFPTSARFPSRHRAAFQNVMS